MMCSLATLQPVALTHNIDVTDGSDTNMLV